MTHVLIIEPDTFVRVRLQQELRDLGYRVTVTDCGREGLRSVRQRQPDLVLLDLDIDDMDAFELLDTLKRVERVPVVVAVPVHDDRRAVRALGAGADDCVDKPFRLTLLGARLHAVARRHHVQQSRPIMQVGDLTIDPGGYSARLGKRSLLLRPKEFELLCYLASREGRIISKRELGREVWRSEIGSERTVDVHLSMLRRQLGESAANPRYLHSFRGVGVKLHAPGA